MGLTTLTARLCVFTLTMLGITASASAQIVTEPPRDVAKSHRIAIGYANGTNKVIYRETLGGSGHCKTYNISTSIGFASVTVNGSLSADEIVVAGSGGYRLCGTTLTPVRGWSATTLTVDGRSGADVIMAGQAWRVFGGGGNDVIIGGKSGQQINGGGGSDSILSQSPWGSSSALDGGSGNDFVCITNNVSGPPTTGTLVGGSGTDTLVGTSLFHDGGFERLLSSSSTCLSIALYAVGAIGGDNGDS